MIFESKTQTKTKLSEFIAELVALGMQHGDILIDKPESLGELKLSKRKVQDPSMGDVTHEVMDEMMRIQDEQEKLPDFLKSKMGFK